MNSKTKKQIIFICESGVIAALYTVLTLVAAAFGLASHEIQIRFSEALCILPLFTPSAIPGLAVGCLVSNMITGCDPLDTLFGTVATLAGAGLAYLLGIIARKKKSAFLKVLIPFPNVISNTLIIPWVLKLVYALEGSVWYFTLTVGIGELISCVALGLPLLFALDKRKNHIFRL